VREDFRRVGTIRTFGDQWFGSGWMTGAVRSFAAASHRFLIMLRVMP
jgi:hypothetical protein